MSKHKVLLIGRVIGVLVVALEIIIQCGNADITTIEYVIKAIEMHNLVNFLNPIAVLYLSIVSCTAANMLCFEILIRILVYGVAAIKEKVQPLNENEL